MTDQQARYDRIAAGYARWWAPVIAPMSVTALDLIAPAVAAGARRILDIGTGTATLAIAALRRWPDVEVVGIDASDGMAAAARAEADRLLGPRDRRRFGVEVAFADELPFDDRAFDAAVSSFVLQLVPSRLAALSEARRVLQPRGRLGHVTWRVGDRPFRPDIEFDQALEDVGIGAREPEPGGGDFASVSAAAAGLRRAGFRDVVATGDELRHRFDTRGYLGFMEEFDEEDLFRGLEQPLRDRLRTRLGERLDALPIEAFELRLPVVRATGIRR